MTERSQHMLKRTVHRSHQMSAESIAKDLQTSCGLHISTTLYGELHGMGFHRAAASKPYITKCNTKHRMSWCKKARHHWSNSRLTM
ncbi:unnamed protein product [Staurois parvus]|uniref:Transposase Tc1-like domain-containing protein n=1 Tax=Staurois parvus TaxID=386267 RepID=A0ABN9BAG2_9NEOB|nr:unnamed protein product [Staurois parvus]